MEKQTFTLEDVKKAFIDGRLYEANELEFDTNGFDSAFDAWVDKFLFKKPKTTEEQPYLQSISVVGKQQYNPQYGNHRICICGHPYYRHFDTYEDMYPCGCKYCQCFTFEEDKNAV